MPRHGRFWLALAATACLAVELVAWLGLVAVARWTGHTYAPVPTSLVSEQQRGALDRLLTTGSSHIEISAALGWTLRASAVGRRTRINSAGIRSDQEFDPEPPAGTVRIAAFGDSYTYGSEVGNHEAWATLLNREGLEVLNFGVPGYGLDQALLRYRQAGIAARAHVVLIGFLSENVNRGVNVFRPFYFADSLVPLAKPRFVPRGAGLELIPNPVSSLEGYRRLLDRPRA